jgi:SPP1 family predicted phage head-tail adaptor
MPKPGAELVEAGSLRHRVWLYRRVQQGDKLGGKTHVWVKAYANMTWAAVDEANAFEVQVAAQTSQQISHRITMRYKADITPDMAIYWPLKNRVFSITGIRRVDAKERRIEVNAVERRDIDTKGWA